MSLAFLDAMSSELGAEHGVLLRFYQDFFDMLAAGAFPELHPQMRRRFLRSLFGLGATCTLKVASRLHEVYGLALHALLRASPPFRCLVLTLPGELSFLLAQKRPPALLLNEINCWRATADRQVCQRTRWLAHLWLTPFNPAVFIRQPRETRKRVLFYHLLCRRTGLSSSVAHTIAYYSCLYRHNVDCPCTSRSGP